ncbi:TraX family protein [Mobiluncus curtisii]|uniref:TraX family protein n=1 Tax=Mobiluncus curtisii TaxID=2051 RepID=UPI0014700D1D|nr:TraX family protein [Mobiluncus curtisii]NMW88426.1 ABC transporter permease [Mobiluncus curtisii]
MASSTNGVPETGPGRLRGLSNFRLKVIAGVFLSFQVASTTVIPYFFGTDLKNNFGALTAVVLSEVVSWCAVPIYAWLLAEGFTWTANRWHYLWRLVILALVCEVPYDLVTFHRPVDWASQNPVFGLALALLVLILIDFIRRRWSGAQAWMGALAVAGAGALWALLLHLGTRQGVINIGCLLIGFALIFYLLRLRENTMMMTAGLLGAVSLVTPAIGVAFLHYRNETLGYRNSNTRWFCYAVYPLLLMLGAAWGTLLV